MKIIIEFASSEISRCEIEHISVNRAVADCKNAGGIFAEIFGIKYFFPYSSILSIREGNESSR